MGGSSGGSSYSGGAHLGPLKAFPTAEGFGKNATGGRGGIVVEVTNLNDSGPGSLRYALEEIRVPRTIVFKVGGGVINAKRNIGIYKGRGNVTIAGQTAPGGGILIKGGELRIEASNVVVRHIRIRMGNNGNNPDNSDGIKIKSFETGGLKNVIIDHCSISWADDENISVSNASNVTIQNSTIGESVRAVLMGDSKNVSFLNNLFVLNNSRNIMAGAVDHKDLSFEQINNIVYGFKWATAGTYGMTFNVIGNKYKLSQDFQTSTEYPVTLSPPPNEERSNSNKIETTRAYLKDNIIDSKLLGVYRQEIKPYLFSSPPKSPSSYNATSASGLDGKLLGHVGASVPKRDAVDTRLINHYKNGNGSLRDSGSFPSISNGTAYKDSDKDGMADDWEKSNGLNPNDASDGKKDSNGGDGYTNLEPFYTIWPINKYSLT